MTTPLCETPLSEVVEVAYDPDQERIREQNYAVDLAIQKLQ